MFNLSFMHCQKDAPIQFKNLMLSSTKVLGVKKTQCNGPNEPTFMHEAGTSTEACYQKIDPRVAGSLICLHQPETDGNVEIVGRGREGGGGKSTGIWL